MFSMSEILTSNEFLYRSSGTRSIRAILAWAAFLFLNANSCHLRAGDIEVLSTFPTNNVVVAGQFAYAAAGSQGIVLVDLANMTIADVVAPPAGTGSVDDVSIDGDLLFTMDGVGAGALSVFSIANRDVPVLVSGPVGVAVGPFAGVSAANGRVVVSGGTSLLNVRSYDENGTLTGPVSNIDLGIGQPDVLVSNDGSLAFVSTDFAGVVDGQSFGITVIGITGAPMILDRVGIPGAGFSPGTDGPANFPIESAQQGNMLFVASGSGVSVYLINDTGTLTLVTQIPLTTNPINVDIRDETLYVVGNSPTPTLTMIDVSNLIFPTIETITLPNGAGPLGIAATDNAVVIADEFLGILVESVFALGDINRDGSVNLLDVAPFIDLLAEGNFQIEADFNDDDKVNLLDVQGFVDALAGK